MGFVKAGTLSFLFLFLDRFSICSPWWALNSLCSPCWPQTSPISASEYWDYGCEPLHPAYKPTYFQCLKWYLE
jgi:hypothetical protein